MDWSLYTYLVFIAVGAVVLAAVLVRRAPELLAPSPRRTRLERCALWAVLVLGIAAVYWNFFTGRSYFAYSDVGSDTLEQYVPYYLNLLDSIRSGTLGLWNFQYGLGVSFMSYQSWTLDPFNLIVVPLCLIFGDGALGPALALAQAAKIAASGLLFDMLLTRYCELPLTRILGSSLFAFCGYLMLWGQHYWLGSVLVMAVLVVVLLEALLESWTLPRFLGLLVSVAVCVMMSTYSGFMVMLFAAAYAVLRVAGLARVSGPRDFFRVFLPLAVPVVCGLLVSCLTVVPYASLMLGDSSRITGAVSTASGADAGSTSLLAKVASYLLEFVPLDWLPYILSRLLGNGLVSTGADIPQTLVSATESFQYVNVYEFVQLGFSVGAMVLLAQFFSWAFGQASRRTKAVAGVASALCLLYCVNFFLPALSNVFVEPKYRSCFALAIPVCLALSVGWEKRVVAGAPSLAAFAGASSLTLATILWSLLNTVNGRLVCLAFLAAFIVFAAAVLLTQCRPDLRQAALVVACAALVGSSVADAFFVTNARDWATAEVFPGAVAASSADESSDADTTAALAWLYTYDDGVYRVEKLYRDWTRLNDSLVQGYMGVSSYNSTLDSDVIDFYRTFWPNILVNGSAYQEYLNDPDHPELLGALGVKYILSHDSLEYPWATMLVSFDSVFVYEVQGSYGLLNLATDVVSETTALSCDDAERDTLMVTSMIVPDEIYDMALAHVSEAESGSNLGSVDAIDTDSLTASINASTACVATLAVPHTTGWHVYVDGEEIETFRSDFGFIGFLVDPGEHSVEARFEPVGLDVGLACAAAGLALAATGWIALRRLGRSGVALLAPAAQLPRTS